MLKSDEDAEKVAFYLLLHEWNSKGLNFQIVFNDPTFISKGMKPDKIMIGIKKPELFISQESGEQLGEVESGIQSEMPTLVPNEVDAEKMEK